MATNDEKQYEFNLTLSGKGMSLEDAWLDAVEAFSCDPGEPVDWVILNEDGEITQSSKWVQCVNRPVAPNVTELLVKACRESLGYLRHGEDGGVNPGDLEDLLSNTIEMAEAEAAHE